MNYIEQINNFWSLNKEFSFTPNEKALYFALLNKCNELGWKNPFNQSNGYLSLEAGMSESAMQKARNTLQQKGLLEFTSGDGRRKNTVYILKKGCHKGSFKNNLSKNLNDTLSGEKSTDNNKQETKVNKTKTSDESSANEELLFWKNFVNEWNEWYKTKFNGSYVYMKKDFAHLKKIYLFLKTRSDEKKFEFTEENFLAAFKFFLNKAWEKDNWLRQNFSIPNVLSQFNQIVNGESNSKGKQQSTGANVSTASILSKVAAMPD